MSKVVGNGWEPAFAGDGDGLTKREWLAGMIMASLSNDGTELDATEAAECAVRWADALLEELAK